MEEKEIGVRTDAGTMTTFVTHPESGGPFPVALLFMDGVGYREQIKENARRFASGGYYVVAPDLFYRAGDRISFDFSSIAAAGADSEERRRMMTVISTVTPDAAVSDTKAAIAAIASDPEAAPGPRVCVGYCMGARIALRAASAMPEDFVAAAGIHPGALVTDKTDSPHHDLASVKGEVYFAFAEIDRSATAELVDRFREEVQTRGVDGVVERIPGVTHGFAMADLPVYDHDAAERHFERTLDLWRRSLDRT